MQGVLCDRVRPRRPEAPSEMTVTERAAYATYLLMTGWRFSNTELACLLGYSQHHGAWALMTSISRVIPIRCSDDDGRWELLRN